MFCEPLQQHYLPFLKGNDLRAKLREEARPLTAVGFRSMLRIHRIKTRLSADDKLVGVNFPLWHDYGHRPILGSRHLSQRDWRVQIRKSADDGNAGQARVAIGVDESDRIKIVRCFVILPIIVAVNNGKSPRFSNSRARISGGILPVIVAIVCVVAREVLRAVVQNVNIIATEEAIRHGTRVY